MKFLILLLFPFYLFGSDPISCAPERKVNGIAVAQVSSIRDGDWYSGSTWSTGKVPAETDDVELKHLITSNAKSIIIRGALRYRHTYELDGGFRKAGIIFKGINAKNFIDGPTDMNKPINGWFPKNIGLYVLGSGYLDLVGEEKTNYTNAVSGLTKGTTQFQVDKAIKWKVGDEIFISPTRMPPSEPGLGENDKFALEFERRIIKAVTGNTITIDPLQYDHLTVADRFTPYVSNITRSFIISGEEGKETHVFIHSNRPFTIKNIEIAHTGGGQKTGNYAIHPHMMYDYSRGSIIQGVAAHDNNFRIFVPHMSHGITIDNNVAFDQYGQSLWYDFQQPTHDAVWTNNLIALTRVRPGVLVSESVDLGQGENNIFNNNIIIYGSTTNGRMGDRAALGIVPLLENRGAVNWHADNMGRPWMVIGNILLCNVTAWWEWINSPWFAHTIEKTTCYNNWRGYFGGAYINGGLLFDSYFYDSPVELKASSGNSIGNSVVRTKMISSNTWKVPTIDRKGFIIPACAYVQDSPIPSGASNKFADCDFIGAIGVMCFSPKKDGDPFKQPKWVELLGSRFTGTPYVIHSSAHKQTRVTTGPNPNYGTGTGLIAEYFATTNFKGKSLKYLEYGIRHYSTWSKTVKESPTGPSRIVDDKFSVRYTGLYEPLTTGQTYFDFEGSAGVRLWIDNQLILDSWTDKVKETDEVRSRAIVLTAGKKVAFKMELFNEGGKRRAILRANGKDIPMFQLYTTHNITEPDPEPESEPNKPPVINAGPDLEDTALSFVIKGSAVDEGPLSVDWEKLSGGDISFQKQTNPAHLYLQDFEPGEYIFKMTVTDEGGLSVSDSVKVTAKPIYIPIQLSAGQDTTITGSSIRLVGSGEFPSYRWQKIKGGDANIRSSASIATDIISLKPGQYTFRLNAGDYSDEVNVTVVASMFPSKEQTGSLACASGKYISFTIPAGKHQASTQALADATALQELNETLAKSCPAEIARYELQGKVIIVYSDWSIQVL